MIVSIEKLVLIATYLHYNCVGSVGHDIAKLLVYESVEVKIFYGFMNFT